jgi:hypothetical protein
MPLVHLRLPFRVVGSRVHSVPQNTITLTCSELLCPLSPVNVTANTRILVQPSEGNFDECNLRDKFTGEHPAGVLIRHGREIGY